MHRLWSRRRHFWLALIIAFLCLFGHFVACSAVWKFPQESARGFGVKREHRIIVRAEILLPSALSRSSYDTKWWQQEWHTKPLQSLLDVDEMIYYWRKRGMVVYQEEVSAQISKRAEALMKFEFKGQGRKLADVVAEARETIARHRRDNAELELTILDLGVINSEHFPFNLTGCQQLTAQVVKGLIFSPSIKILASDIVHRITSGGQHEYNGVHLRFETDALSAWAWEDYAQQVLWEGYAKGMKTASFNADVDLYIASGLDPSSSEFLNLSNRLEREGLCRKIVHKESFLPQNILAGLHSEQKALLDLLVLAHSSRYVGTLRSSFSCYVRDLRTLRNAPSNSSTIIKVGDFPPSILPFQELILSNV